MAFTTLSFRGVGGSCQFINQDWRFYLLSRLERWHYPQHFRGIRGQSA
ncbi:MAG: hypothetical protein ACLUDU_02205 [Butyricimonas faecihominis]